MLPPDSRANSSDSDPLDGDPDAPLLKRTPAP